MPRFLNTYTGEFVEIAEIDATPYAILSHTWRSAGEGGEQTHDAVIKRACEVARKAGYRLIWIDSCCIDKRSSAELSEAINSMYALYRDADVCYVYLADVAKNANPSEDYSDFWMSRWHKRGWTLQELVAPPYVVFLTDDWTLLGTKTSLASTLEKITGVDAAILLGIKPVESASVAKRMSWAAKRQTTRVEDRAYSLLGLFGVHMSPIYGEGTNAFLRLQEEIIKHIPDQSILAWGRSRTLSALDAFADKSGGGWFYQDYGLLAPSPDAFEDVGDITPITPSEFVLRMGPLRDLRPPPLHCVFTPQGAQITLMTIPLPLKTAEMLVDYVAPDCLDCREAMAHSPFRCLALLRCTDRDGHLIALPLRCPEEDVGAAENVVIGIRATCSVAWHLSPRVVRLSAAVSDVAPTRVEVSLLRHWHNPVKPKGSRRRFSKTLNHPLEVWEDGRNAPKILLAPNCEKELCAVGVTITQIELHQRPRSREITLTTILNMNSAKDQAPRDDQHAHVTLILIELALRRETFDAIPGHFTVDDLPIPSTIESSHPASPTPAGVSSGAHLHDESCQTPSTAGNPHRQRRSFDIDWHSYSRTLAEAEF
ncbi:heterokaryon incompatibility protein-domain-containing protein, partial [Lenzites betulinus]